LNLQPSDPKRQKNAKMLFSWGAQPQKTPIHLQQRDKNGDRKANQFRLKKLPGRPRPNHRLVILGQKLVPE
jgi:hypothetical protein